MMSKTRINLMLDFASDIGKCSLLVLIFIGYLFATAAGVYFAYIGFLHDASIVTVIVSVVVAVSVFTLILTKAIFPVIDRLIR